MERDSTSGATEELTTVSGSSIRCTAPDILLGMMGVGTRASTSKIRNKEKECFTGLTAASTKEAGLTASSMGTVSTTLAKENLSTESGKMARESSG